MCLKGATSFVPLAAVSKRQRCVFHSTPEAEIVAADHGLRVEALPAVTLWELLLGRKLKVRLMEDNDAAVKIKTSGRNPAIRHMWRTHNVDLAFLNECLKNGHYTIEYCKSAAQAADIFTKEFRDAVSWNRVCRLIGLTWPGQWWPKGGTKAEKASPPAQKQNKLATAPAEGQTPGAMARRLVEFCCTPDSVLGCNVPGSEGCEVIRLTEEDDVTTVAGLRKAMKAVQKPGTLH